MAIGSEGGQINICLTMPFSGACHWPIFCYEWWAGRPPYIGGEATDVH